MTPIPFVANLLHPRLLAGVALYFIAAAVAVLVHARVERAVAGTPWLSWPWEHLGLAWLRALALLLFVLLTGPTLFGLSGAAPATPAADHLGNDLLNLAVLLALLLPLVPPLHRLPALLLPIQCTSLAALLFSRLYASTAAGPIVYWPPADVLATLVVVSVTTHLFGQRLCAILGERLGRTLQVSDLEPLLAEGSAMLFQLPAILIYTRYLGAQWQTA